MGKRDAATPSGSGKVKLANCGAQGSGLWSAVLVILPGSTSFVASTTVTAWDSHYRFVTPEDMDALFATAKTVFDNKAKRGVVTSTQVRWVLVVGGRGHWEWSGLCINCALLSCALACKS